MGKIKKSGRLLRFFFLAGLILFAFKAWAFFSAEDSGEKMINSDSWKKISLSESGATFLVLTKSQTVEDFLSEENISLGEDDQIFPSEKDFLFSGSNIEIRRAVNVKLEVDGKTIEGKTLAGDVEGFLWESEVKLYPLDKVSPSLKSPLSEGVKILITRISEEEVVESESIDFKTIVKKDDKLGWREKKVQQKGEKGIREVKYRITYKNGKEVSRVVLGRETVKDPLEQIETQGTYVKIGKSHTGQGTWYAFKGGLYAASPWLPMGSFAKVTNKANGKSVIVQINDRGPFGDGRIIDLDKVAFSQVASLGAGVIDVKVEEIMN